MKFRIKKDDESEDRPNTYIPRGVGVRVDYGYYIREVTTTGSIYHCKTCGIVYYSHRGVEYHQEHAHGVAIQTNPVLISGPKYPR